MERYFQAGKKKRYAYLCTWKDGMDCEPKVSISGFQRSDTTLMTDQLQQDILKAILYGATDEELGQLVYDAVQKISATDPDWNMIGIPAVSVRT